MRADDYRWTCACCGKPMRGLPMDIAFQRPDRWDELNPSEVSASLLQSDFCSIHSEVGGEQLFIRALLPIPAVDFDVPFNFGVWIAVSQDDCRVYSDGFESELYARPGCPGHLANAIPEYDGSRGLPVRVTFSNAGKRPKVDLTTGVNRLCSAQADGVDRVQIERWVAPRIAH